MHNYPSNTISYSFSFKMNDGLGCLYIKKQKRRMGKNRNENGFKMGLLRLERFIFYFILNMM